MQIDAALTATSLRDVPAAARAIEDAGYDGTYTFEGPHDALFPLLLAAEHTTRLRLTTAVLIAFARSPMTVAQTAYDVGLASDGRFTLGLGSQIRTHIEKRFSMTWSHPAARMREYVLAVRAIWASWHEGVPLDFRGDFYSHTLMTPFFDPGPAPHGVPRIALAGVGPRMTEVAGEVADGFIVHPFTTERFLRDDTIPALHRGLARAGRGADDFEVMYPCMIAVGEDDASLARARDLARPRVAFYASTPAYRIVLERHGWGDLQGELNRLSKTGDWTAMAARIDDEVLDAFVVSGPAAVVGPEIHRRYGDLVHRISFDASTPLAPEQAAVIMAALR